MRRRCRETRYGSFDGFNEAEASLPRMRRLTGRPFLLFASFNEAEASLPRMRPIMRNSSAGAMRRFNEAEASLPRMPRIRQSSLPSAVRASMRPRHLCLGCVWQVFGLQCLMGRFNEAEASLPRMPAPASRPPSRSWRFNEAEASLPRMPTETGMIGTPEVTELQ